MQFTFFILSSCHKNSLAHLFTKKSIKVLFVALNANCFEIRKAAIVAWKQWAKVDCMKHLDFIINKKCFSILKEWKIKTCKKLACRMCDKSHVASNFQESISLHWNLLPSSSLVCHEQVNSCSRRFSFLLLKTHERKQLTRKKGRKKSFFAFL